MPLWLLRHAHTEWNGPPRRLQGRADIGLSEQGWDEAAALGRRLIVPDRIVSSPARRCRETIEVLFGRRAPAPTFDERLWEIDNGRFAGLTEAEAGMRYAREWHLWRTTPARIRPGGGETLVEMQARVAAAIGALEDAIDDERATLVVTHGGPIRVLRCFYEGRDLNQFHALRVGNLATYVVVRRGEALGLEARDMRAAAPNLTS